MNNDVHQEPWLHTLYEEVRGVAREAPAPPDRPWVQNDENVKRCRQRLLDVILVDLESKIRGAALAGSREAVVLQFKGTHTFPAPEGSYFYLFLLKGHASPDRRHDRELNPPLLDTLKGILQPFEVRHVWVPGTDDNTLLVKW